MIHSSLLPICSFALLVALVGGQLCSTFDADTQGWYGSVATVAWSPQVLTVGDRPGASYAVAPQSYTGDYWRLFPTGCGQFCFDIRVIDDSFPNASPLIVRYFTFTSIAAGLSATFVTTQTLQEGGPWSRFCAPIAPLDAAGNPPTTPDGYWSWSGGSAAQWNLLFSTVSSVTFPADTNSWQNELFHLDNICLVPLTTNPPAPPVITGPLSACNNPATYCLSSASSGFVYGWSVATTPSVPLTVDYSAAPKCITVTWPPGQGGVVTLKVTGSYPYCGTSTTTLTVAPCDVVSENCCKDKNLTITNEKFSIVNNNLVFNPVLSYPALTLKISMTLVGGVFVNNICRTTSTSFQQAVSVGVSSPYANGYNGFAAPAGASYPQEVVWLVSSFGGTTGSFPVSIGPLPPVPAWPCHQRLRFCIKYTFYSGCCESCEVVECYTYIRKPFIIIDNPTTVLNTGVPIRFSVRTNPSGSTATIKDNFISVLSIKTGPAGARLSGASSAKSNNATGIATFADAHMNRPGSYVLQLVSIYTDPYQKTSGLLESEPYEFGVTVTGSALNPEIPPVIPEGATK